MAIRAGTIEIDITGDLSGLDAAIQRAEKSIKGAGDRLADVGATLTTRLSLPLALVGGAAIKMGVDAVESENLFSVAMGDAAEATRQWSEQLRADLGLNAFAIRKQAGTFNAMLIGMGQAPSVAAEMSRSLTLLGADLESFFNLAAGEGFAKLASGLAGEIEPLKRLGIVVNENTVNQAALAAGLIRTGQKMTEQQKVLARYLAIVKSTGLAQGDLARTIESPANQIRRLVTQVTDAATQLGVALLPALARVTTVLVGVTGKVADAVRAFSTWSERNRILVASIFGIAVGLGPALLAIGSAIKVVGALVGVIGLVASPAGLAVAAIAALGLAGIQLVRHWDDVKLRFVLVWGAIKDAVLSGVDTALAALEKLVGFVPGVGTALARARAEVSDLLDETLAETGRAAGRIEAKILADVRAEVDKTALSVEQFKPSLDFLADAFRALGNESGEAAAKRLERIRETVVGLESDLRAAQLRAELLGSGFELGEEQAQALRSAINSLTNEGVALDVALGSGGETLRDYAARLRELEGAARSAAKAERDLEVRARKTEEVYREIATPLEEYNRRVRELNELLAAGDISQEAFTKSVEVARDRLEKATRAATDNRFVDLGENAGRDLVHGILSGTFELEDFLRRALIAFAELAIVKAFKIALGIASPSKVGHNLGRNFGLAVAAGIQTARGAVGFASGRLALAASLPLGAAPGIGAGPVLRAGPGAIAGVGSGPVVPSSAVAATTAPVIDFSSFPAARNALETQRDGDWLRYLGGSLDALHRAGWRGPSSGA